MNTTNNDRLRAAAQEGDINLLYKLIQEDPHILEHIDSIPFVETPLHIASSFGQLQFATEIMRLKPSFAWKLNQQGFSPIHLAMQQGQKRMVLRLVDINKDLVQVKGREGLTPLHLASQGGDVDLLARFLFACPDSIEDVTMRSETALHVAVKNGHYDALQILVGWLKKSPQKDAKYIKKTILNWKDEADNTILHISALNNDSQALRLLVKTRMDLNAKNLESSTALDIAASAEIKSLLCASGAKYGSSVTDAPALADMLRSKIPFAGRILVSILRLRSEISEEQRSALLVVAALVATAIFQTALSPPGGVYQANAGDNVNTTSLNSTAIAATQANIGKSVMPQADFSSLTIVNALSLFFSTMAIYILTPGGKLVGNLMFMPVFSFLCCYLYSVKVISPKGFSSVFFYTMLSLLFLWFLGLYATYHTLYDVAQYHIRKATKTRNRTRGNRW